LDILADYALTSPVQRQALPLQSVNNQCVRVHTGAGDIVWKVYSSHDDPDLIRYEHHLLTSLAASELSFAVPAPLPGRDGETLRRYAGQWHALAPWLPGARLDPAAPDQVELLGAAVGELLATLRHYPATPRPGHNLFGALFDFPPSARNPFTLTTARLGVPSTPTSEDLLEWWREEATRLHAFVEGPYRSLPWQVCHNDVAPANILVKTGHVSGVLDFEFAAPAPRALDVAHGLRMTMRVWENAEPWETVRRFCHGYTRWAPLTPVELQAIPDLMRLRGAITVLWWLGRHAATDDPVIALQRVEYLRNAARWLDRHQSDLQAVLAEAMQ
jgi:Ser/Thr protein kinase RdoA (MazF antagonist)